MCGGCTLLICHQSKLGSLHGQTLSGQLRNSCACVTRAEMHHHLLNSNHLRRFRTVPKYPVCVRNCCGNLFTNVFWLTCVCREPSPSTKIALCQTYILLDQDLVIVRLVHGARTRGGCIEQLLGRNRCSQQWFTHHYIY